MTNIIEEPMVRIWYEDESYIDVPARNAWEYYDDPDYDHCEDI